MVTVSGLRLEVVPVNLAPVPPLPSRRSYLVRVYGQGMEGWGEVCCVQAEAQGMEAVLQDWSKRFPSFVLTLTGEGVEGLPGAPFPVWWGVESALLDALARREGIPLAALLAEEVTPVRVWAWGGRIHKECGRTYREANQRGYTVIKYKLEHLEENLRALKKAWKGREALALWLDANRRFSMRDWERVMDTARALPILGVEEPVWEEPASWEVFPFPVWLDESALDPRNLDRYLQAPIAGVVLKPARLGSWRELNRRVERIQAAGKAVVLTHMLEGTVGRLHALHRAAALGLPGPHGLHLQDGEPVWAVGDAPGIGEVNP